MYIYNVTVHVDDSVIEDWLTWIKPHIKEVIATGKFTKAIMTEVLADQDSGGRTFSIQYTSNSREDLDKYYEEDAPKLRTDGLVRFSNKVLAFRTELKIIDEF